MTDNNCNTVWKEHAQCTHLVRSTLKETKIIKFLTISQYWIGTTFTKIRCKEKSIINLHIKKLEKLTLFLNPLFIGVLSIQNIFKLFHLISSLCSKYHGKFEIVVVFDEFSIINVFLEFNDAFFSMNLIIFVIYKI